MSAQASVFCRVGPKLGLGLIGGLALAFAFLACGFVLSMDDGLAWLQVWYGTLVSKDFISAPNAYVNVQRAYLHAMNPFMKMHVIGMATALAFGWLQFVPALRRATPRLHRGLGGLLVFSMLLGGMGAVLMVFGGNSYGSADYGQQLTVEVGMVSLAVLMWFSLLIALRWLGVGDLRVHGDWMVMTYALVCTAFSLRIGFLVHGWRGLSFEEAFHLSTQFTVQPMVLIGTWIIALRRRTALRHTESTPSTTGLWGAMTRQLPARGWPWLLVVSALVLILATLSNSLPFSGYRYHLGVSLNVVCVAIAMMVASFHLSRAIQLGHKETAAQWGVRSAGLMAFPLFVLLVWGTLLPTGKTTEILLNTAPVFAAVIALYAPDIAISAMAWKFKGRINKRG